jgi:hypothetical protein
MYERRIVRRTRSLNNKKNTKKEICGLFAKKGARTKEQRAMSPSGGA